MTACHVVGTAVCSDPRELVRSAPELWRQVRRFNPQVQAAIAAASEVLTGARDAGSAALIALAPHHNGSPELSEWVDRIHRTGPDGSLRSVRMNPTHTLHAVDNLALSHLTIRLGHRGYSCCLGGAPGMAWEALEMALDRLTAGESREVVIFAGDEDGRRPAPCALGAAIALALSPRQESGVRLFAVDRERREDPAPIVPHAAAGLVWLIEQIDRLAGAAASEACEVPAAHADGLDRIRISLAAAGSDPPRTRIPSLPGAGP